MAGQERAAPYHSPLPSSLRCPGLLILPFLLFSFSLFSSLPFPLFFSSRVSFFSLFPVLFFGDCQLSFVFPSLLGSSVSTAVSIAFSYVVYSPLSPVPCLPRPSSATCVPSPPLPSHLSPTPRPPPRPCDSHDPGRLPGPIASSPSTPPLCLHLIFLSHRCRLFLVFQAFFVHLLFLLRSFCLVDFISLLFVQLPLRPHPTMPSFSSFSSLTFSPSSSTTSTPTLLPLHPFPNPSPPPSPPPGNLDSPGCSVRIYRIFRTITRCILSLSLLREMVVAVAQFAIWPGSPHSHRGCAGATVAAVAVLAAAAETAPALGSFHRGHVTEPWAPADGKLAAPVTCVAASPALDPVPRLCSCACLCPVLLGSLRLVRQGRSH